MPKAPVAVTIPSRGPRIGRKWRKARQMARSSTSEWARMIPASRKARSKTASSPTMEPVCDMAAWAPAALRPVFKAMMGFCGTMRPATSRNRRPCFMPSRCSTMIRVWGSCSRYSRTSTTSTSPALPTSMALPIRPVNDDAPT